MLINYLVKYLLGMAQQVVFSTSVSYEFDAILLDEPFVSLDAHSRYQLQNWLFQK